MSPARPPGLVQDAYGQPHPVRAAGPLWKRTQRPSPRGLRSDAESVHSQYKRTLIADRALTLGLRRGIVDYYCWSWYSNALTERRARAMAEPARGSQPGRTR